METGFIAVLVFQLLAIGVLLRLSWHIASVNRRRVDEMEAKIDHIDQRLREALAAYKLEVAKSYASVGLMKDVERRLTDHLVRIELKLPQGNL